MNGIRLDEMGNGRSGSSASDQPNENLLGHTRLIMARAILSNPRTVSSGPAARRFPSVIARLISDLMRSVRDVRNYTNS